MGITNTIAKLKSYFEAWHTADKHEFITDDIDNTTDRVETIENILGKKETNNTTIFELINGLKTARDKINSFIDTNGATYKTLSQLNTAIKSKASTDTVNNNGKWEQITPAFPTKGTSSIISGLNGSLYVNKYLRMSILHIEFNYKYNKSTQYNKWVDTGITIKKDYAPTVMKAPHSPLTTIRVKSNKIYIRTTWTTSETFSVETKVLWKY